MKPSWQNRRERGSASLLKLITWLSLSRSRRFGRLLLYPISFYFFVFSGASRRSSLQYLSLIFGHQVPVWRVFRHYHTFSKVLLDRVFFLRGRLEEFDIRFEGREMFEQHYAKNKGCLLLGAHIGSFEVLRSLGSFERNLPLKILMYPDNAKRFVELMRQLNPEMAANVIPLGRPQTMLQAKQHVEKGGLIGLLGDRITRGDKLVQTELLGRPAQLPAGPFLLASILQVPVVFFCGLYRGDNRYDIYFEHFADKIVIDPKRRAEDLQMWIDRYAARMTHYSQLEPYNWFNFYDFWENTDRAA